MDEVRTLVSYGEERAAFIHNLHDFIEIGRDLSRKTREGSDQDLRYIYQRLQNMKGKVDQMTTATMGLSNIVGSRQALSEARRSVKEAKSTKTLTVVGLIFIPLAYTCALFSMSNEFRPGSHLFWVYFAVSVPLVFLVFVGTFVIQLGYDEDAAWSGKKFRGALLAVFGKDKAV